MTSRSIRLWLLLILPVAGAARDPGYVLSAPPRELVRSEELFKPFALAVRADVERLLTEPARVDDPAALKLLLSMRVHLAHYFADNAEAVATAAWIRSLQTDPAEKAFAGLTTLAAVRAREENPGAGCGDAGYRASFAREFTRQLAALPRTPQIAAMLQGQKAKISGLTEASLLAEVRDTIGPAIDRRGFCGLAEADQLVRVRHRLVSILPVKAETVAALDAAIALRPSP